MNTKERLIKFLDYISISQRKFEESVGLSNGFINNIGDSIRVRSLDKITSVYPDLNTAWLLTGEGSMLKTSDSVVSEPQAAYGDAGLLKEIQELREAVKKKNNQIEALESEIKDLKEMKEVLKEMIEVQKGSISDKDLIIEILNEKIDTFSPVKEKSALK